MSSSTRADSKTSPLRSLEEPYRMAARVFVSRFSNQRSLETSSAASALTLQNIPLRIPRLQQIVHEGEFVESACQGIYHNKPYSCRRVLFIADRCNPQMGLGSRSLRSLPFPAFFYIGSGRGDLLTAQGSSSWRESKPNNDSG